MDKKNDKDNVLVIIFTIIGKVVKLIFNAAYALIRIGIGL